MPVVLKLGHLMSERGISLNELADKVGITNVNLSRIKTGKVKAVRFSTLGKLCEILECQPGDILAFISDEDYQREFGLVEDDSEEDA